MKWTVVALAVLIASPAGAGSKEWAENCADLYLTRNQFFHQRGLCFTRDFAKSVWKDNEKRCMYKHAEDVPISKSEEEALDKIRTMERTLKCPRP